MTTVADAIAVLDRAYPPHLAESWDKVGLICGDPAGPADKILLALDCTQEVADAAVAAGADMLVVHHPLLLRGVTSVAANTNADSARPGVNDQLAYLVGITPGRPIKPIRWGLDKWGVQVPIDQAPALKSALFAAGAGNIGEYSECAFAWEGAGQFRPSTSAQPAIGNRDELTKVTELRIEFVAPSRLREAIMGALRTAHPYEEPAFDVVATEPTQPLEEAYGLGRIGDLPHPMRFADFVQQVANALPVTEWGIRAAGDPDQMVQTIAVSSGSGDSFLDAVTGLGVDVYVTSDLRHHPADEHLRGGGPLLIDTAHWASEYPWTSQAADILATALPHSNVSVLPIRTDPWTISAHPTD